jgi:hypothetical protein
VVLMMLEFAVFLAKTGNEAPIDKKRMPKKKTLQRLVYLRK